MGTLRASHNARAFLFSLLVFASACTLATPAEAATLFLSPTSVSARVGESVTVLVYVSSTDQAMNAVSAAITFPRDLLEVRTVSKANSILSYWTAEPTFSNGSGTVNFEGIAFNPGYTGSAGRIMSVTFRALAPGSADLAFSSASVLANDGDGSQILSGKSGTTIAVTNAPAQKAPVTPTPAPVDTTPPGAVRVSFPMGTTTDLQLLPIIFESKDALSGIDHYAIMIDGTIVTSALPGDAGKPFYVPIKKSGSLSVIAFDRAGNSTASNPEMILFTGAIPAFSATFVIALLLGILIVIAAANLAVLFARRPRGGRRGHGHVRRQLGELEDSIAEALDVLDDVHSHHELAAQKERLLRKITHLIDKTEAGLEKEPGSK